MSGIYPHVVVVIISGTHCMRLYFPFTSSPNLSIVRGIVAVATESRAQGYRPDMMMHPLRLVISQPRIQIGAVSWCHSARRWIEAAYNCNLELLTQIEQYVNDGPAESSSPSSEPTSFAIASPWLASSRH